MFRGGAIFWPDIRFINGFLEEILRKNKRQLPENHMNPDINGVCIPNPNKNRKTFEKSSVGFGALSCFGPVG